MIRRAMDKTAYPKIIAICGMKRSGKDTIADYMVSKYGYEKVKIASPLKSAMKVLFGFTDQQLEGDEKDIKDMTWGIEPRKLMQYFGTEMMQYQIQDVLPGIGRCFWINKLINDHIKENNKYIVIPDLRFKHEYDMLVDYNAVFWRVDRTNTLEDSHVSEREFLDIPVQIVFNNNTDKQKLYLDVEQYLIKNISSN